MECIVYSIKQKITCSTDNENILQYPMENKNNKEPKKESMKSVTKPCYE